jgi:hypothetical protein
MLWNENGDRSAGFANSMQLEKPNSERHVPVSRSRKHPLAGSKVRREHRDHGIALVFGQPSRLRFGSQPSQQRIDAAYDLRLNGFNQQRHKLALLYFLAVAPNYIAVFNPRMRSAIASIS